MEIHPDALIEDAIEQCGHDDFGDPSWREGFDVLVDSLSTEASLSGGGRLLVWSQLSQSLANRLSVVAWRKAHPDFARPVEKPVFIIGLPRTGTTLLSNLLDLDPANRSLLRFEARDSTPPPGPEPEARQLAGAQEELDLLYLGNPELKRIHYERADSPTECIALLGQAFRSVHYELMTRIPKYGDWHLAADMTSAYAWHRDVLQVLQSRSGGRWCLKSYCHALALPALNRVYPDARFVVTHRAIDEVVASQCSLALAMHAVSTEEGTDRYVGRRWLDLLVTMTERRADFRSQVDSNRFIDIDYQDLVRAPEPTLAKLYERLGWRYDAGMEGAIARPRAPKDRFGSHRYDLSHFGLSRDEVASRFRRYVQLHPAAAIAA